MWHGHEVWKTSRSRVFVSLACFFFFGINYGWVPPIQWCGAHANRGENTLESSCVARDANREREETAAREWKCICHFNCGREWTGSSEGNVEERRTSFYRTKKRPNNKIPVVRAFETLTDAHRLSLSSVLLYHSQQLKLNLALGACFYDLIFRYQSFRSKGDSSSDVLWTTYFMRVST